LSSAVVLLAAEEFLERGQRSATQPHLTHGANGPPATEPCDRLEYDRVGQLPDPILPADGLELGQGAASRTVQ
jgi:hypothetical protein